MGFGGLRQDLLIISGNVQSMRYPHHHCFVFMLREGPKGYHNIALPKSEPLLTSSEDSIAQVPKRWAEPGLPPPVMEGDFRQQ